MQSEISEIAKELAILAEGKTMLSGKFFKVDSDQKLIFEIENVIKNFTNTLNLNPSISAVIGPQLEKKENELSSIIENYLSEIDDNSTNQLQIIKLESEKVELKENLSNLQVALSANPALSEVIG